MSESMKVSDGRREDGTLKVKPLDPDYFNKYYHRKGVELITCKCGVPVRRNYLSNHMKTKRCREALDQLVEVASVEE
jgi:hypothetical protein